MNGVWTILVTYDEIYLKNNTFENLIIKKSDFLNYYQKQMIRTSLTNGVINLDSDFSKYIESLSNPWVIEGFNVQDWVVKPWKARVKAERTNWETIYCYVENTEDVSLSWNDGKVYIVIDQEDIDSGLVSEDWSNIARIEEGEVRPVKNFLKLSTIDSGDVTDERYFITNVSELWSAVNNYGPATSGTDSYTVNIQGVTEYKVGNVYRFMADVDNEWNATLNINGLWAVEIRKNHDKILDNGDIEAGQIVEVAYDWTYFQMNSQVATVVDVASLWNTQYKTWVAWENLEVWDVCCLVDFENDYFEMKLFWTTESSVEYEVIGNGWNDNSITLWLWRRWNSSWEDLVVELLDGETVIASSQIARSGLTEDTTVETVCSWWESIETEKGKVYTLRLRTYDNSVDADKGFYVNRTDTKSFWFKEDKLLSILWESIIWYYTNFTVKTQNGYWFTLTVKSWVDTIEIYEDDYYFRMKKNWTIVVYWDRRPYVVNFTRWHITVVDENMNTTIWNIDVDADMFHITNYGGGLALSFGYWFYVSPILNNTQWVNYKSDSLCNSVFHKWNDYNLYVVKNNTNKWDDVLFETWWISTIFKNWNPSEMLFIWSTLVWYYNHQWVLIYSPKYFQEVPTLDTNFVSYKNAVLKYCLRGGSSPTTLKLNKNYVCIKYVTISKDTILQETQIDAWEGYKATVNWTSPGWVFYYID